MVVAFVDGWRVGKGIFVTPVGLQLLATDPRMGSEDTSALVPTLPLTTCGLLTDPFSLCHSAF